MIWRILCYFGDKENLKIGLTDFWKYGNVCNKRRPACHAALWLLHERFIPPFLKVWKQVRKSAHVIDYERSTSDSFDTLLL